MLEVEREAKIKYFRQQETEWRETAYKIAEEERGEAPFAEAMRKADEFGRQATELEGMKIADELGLHYDGIQEEIGMQFTDVAETGTTFYANTLEEARTKLAEKRELFAKPPMGELLECMICHQKFDHLILGTCEGCYKKWTGGK